MNDEEITQAPAFLTNFEKPERVEVGLDVRPVEHAGKFYFKRAFLTTFAILTAVSAFIAAWMVIWALIFGGLYGLGKSIDEDPSAYPTDEPTTSQETPTYQGVQPTCDPDYEAC